MQNPPQWEDPARQLKRLPLLVSLWPLLEDHSFCRHGAQNLTSFASYINQVAKGTSKAMQRKVNATHQLWSLSEENYQISNTHLFFTPSMNSGILSTVPISPNILSTACYNQGNKSKLNHEWLRVQLNVKIYTNIQSIAYTHLILTSKYIFLSIKDLNCC